MLGDLVHAKKKGENRMKFLQESQLMRYILGGGMTTAVNYLIFIVLSQLQVHYLLGNSLAWAGAVVFAFFVNRHMVFQSAGSAGREFVQFAGLRLATLGVENLLLYLLVDAAGCPALISKVVVSVVTVVLNYMACKVKIFAKGGKDHEEC